MNTANFEGQKSLFQKLVKILGSAGHIKKTGHNSHNNYQYATEADIVDSIRDKLVEQGIFVFSSVEGIERVESLTTVKILHTFVDSETGAAFPVYSYGQGSDKHDKGVYKAITGATKYMYQKNFLIASEDDPERDGANKSYVRSTAPIPDKKTEVTTNSPVTSESNGNHGSKPSFSVMKKSTKKVEDEVPY
jgi:hypothetical protein